MLLYLVSFLFVW